MMRMMMMTTTMMMTMLTSTTTMMMMMMMMKMIYRNNDIINNLIRLISKFQLIRFFTIHASTCFQCNRQVLQVFSTWMNVDC